VLTVSTALMIAGLCLLVLAPFAPPSQRQRRMAERRQQRQRRMAEQKHHDCLRHIAALEADLGVGDGVSLRTTRATREDN
jgi:hypothetical protein